MGARARFNCMLDERINLDWTCGLISKNETRIIDENDQKSLGREMSHLTKGLHPNKELLNSTNEKTC